MHQRHIKTHMKFPFSKAYICMLIPISVQVYDLSAMRDYTLSCNKYNVSLVTTG